MVGWAPRIKVPAVILSERQSRCAVGGIDPTRENISFFSELAFAGETLADMDDGRIVIGASWLGSYRPRSAANWWYWPGG